MPSVDTLNKCDSCQKDFDELYGKGPFLGNKDEGYYCKDCYEITHDEEWSD